MQTEKIIKRVIHRHIQTASTKKKLVRHIHVQTNMPATRRFRHACNQKCLVEHTECFHATHSCKKQLEKNIVSTSLEVVNKVQEKLSPGNFWDKVVSFIPECVSNLTSTLNKKKVATVMGMQKPEPCTSTEVQMSGKSISLVSKRKTTTSKASTVLQKSSNPPPSTKPLTATAQVHNSPTTTTRSATRSSAKNIDQHFPIRPLLI